MRKLKKWSFLWILLLCGIVIMTATRSWAAVGEPIQKVSGWLVGKLDAAGKEETQEVLGEDVRQGGSSPEGTDGTGFQPGGPEEIGGTGTSAGGSENGGTPGESLAADEGSEGSGGIGTSAGGSESGGTPGESLAADEGSEGSGGIGTSAGGSENGGTPGESLAADEGSEGSGGTGSQPGGSEGTGGTEFLPQTAADQTVEDDYFSDAVFIGDSRMVGMYEYGNLIDISTFYVSKGLTIFKLFDSEIVETGDERGKITVEQALSENRFAKIYLEVGINEMGTGDLNRFLTTYQAALDRLQELQPDAIIYVQAIMKVTTERSDRGDYINNGAIEERNAGLAALADNQKIFYLDVNPLVVDDTGGLDPELTYDGVHLKGKHVEIWKNFLKEHAVLLD